MADEKGLTLVELLVVITIFLVVTSIALPSYVGMRNRAADTTAKANLRGMTPALEAYRFDNGTYRRANPRKLRRRYDKSVDQRIRIRRKRAASYCAQITINGRTWALRGPGGEPTRGSC